MCILSPDIEAQSAGSGKDVLCIDLTSSVSDEKNLAERPFRTFDRQNHGVGNNFVSGRIHGSKNWKNDGIMRLWCVASMEWDYGSPNLYHVSSIRVSTIVGS